jgi:hypothetical protein
MQNKTAKVTSIKPDGNFGAGTQFGITYKHLIEFDNGDKGHYNSKKEVQDRFVIGKESTYTIETKVNGQYTNYSIKPVDDKAGFKKENKDQGVITALSCISSAVNLHARTSTSTAEDVLADADKFFKYAMSKTTA